MQHTVSIEINSKYAHTFNDRFDVDLCRVDAVQCYQQLCWGDWAGEALMTWSHIHRQLQSVSNTKRSAYNTVSEKHELFSNEYITCSFVCKVNNENSLCTPSKRLKTSLTTTGLSFISFGNAATTSFCKHFTTKYNTLTRKTLNRQQLCWE